jgi:hypothetical protein
MTNVVAPGRGPTSEPQPQTGAHVRSSGSHLQRCAQQTASQFGRRSAKLNRGADPNITTERRSYLMNELKNNYSRLDYSKLETHEAEFKRIVDRVHAASKNKRKIRVTN